MQHQDTQTTPLDAMEAALNRNPADSETFSLYVKTIMATGAQARGAVTLEEIARKLGSPPPLLTLLVQLYWQIREYAKALPHLNMLKAQGANFTAQHYAMHGVALVNSGKPNEALEALTVAQSLGNDTPDVWYQNAMAHDYLGELHAAQNAYQQAAQRDPSDPKFRYAAALLEMKRSNLSGGFEHYGLRKAIAARKEVHGAQGRSVTFETGYDARGITPWNGESLGGKRVLIEAEQGIGDILMFAGFLPYFSAQAERVVVLMEEYLLALMQRSFPHITFCSKTDAQALSPQDFDVHIDIGDAITYALSHYQPAAHPPYLKPDAARTASLRARYEAAAKGKKIVGISWNTINPQTGFIRNMPLSALRPLLKREDCQFVSLQYMDHAQEIAALSKKLPTPILLDDSVDPVRDKDALAAQIAAMDTVVSIQNSTVHMAGALGVNTWLMLSKSSDWRWGASADTSVFYKSVRIIRQSRFGDWSDVVEKVRQEI